MRLTLTSADQRRLAGVSETMLSPLDHEDPGAWCEAVLAGAKALLGADSGGATIPLEDGSWMRADRAAAARDYDELTRTLDAQLRFLDRAVRLGAYDRSTLFRPYLERYHASSYYNEYIIPNRMFDGIGLAVRLREGGGVRTVAQLILHHDDRRRRFGPRGPALLRLLLPSFRAGARAWNHLARRRARLASELDRLEAPLLVADVHGRPLHENACLQSLLATDPDAPLLREHLHAFARRLAERRRTAGGGAPAPVGTVRTRTGAYELYGSLSTLLSSERPVVLVGVERSGPRWPEPEELARRFGLTRAQARIALLLGRGLTNDEIARTLVISPATARNHTARVREKLGVGSRSKVAEVLLRGDRVRRD